MTLQILQLSHVFPFCPVLSRSVCYLCRVREQKMLQITTSAIDITIRSFAVLQQMLCKTLKGNKGWCIPLWRLMHSIRSVGFCIFRWSIRTLQMCTQEQLFPGYNTSGIRVRKNKVFFQFLIINNLLVEVVLVWEQMNSIKQQPCNVAQWVVWFLGIPVLFSLLQGTVRLKGNKDIQKLSLSNYSFLVF